MPTPTPTDAQIKKLPVWAQAHIKMLDRQRDAAVKALNHFTDDQTESNVWIQEYPSTGEEGKPGPIFKKRYLQTKRVYFKLPRVEMELEVFLNEPDHRVEFRSPRGYPYIEPSGANSFALVPRESEFDMHYPHSKLLRAALDAPGLNREDFVKKYGFSQAVLPDLIAESLPKKPR